MLDSGLTPDNLSELLMPKRPKVLFSGSEQLEYVSEIITNEVLEVRDGVKVRVLVTIESVRTKKTTVREYNPELNYQDSVDSFIVPEPPTPPTEKT